MLWVSIHFILKALGPFGGTPLRWENGVLGHGLDQEKCTIGNARPADTTTAGGCMNSQLPFGAATAMAVALGSTTRRHSHPAGAQSPTTSSCLGTANIRRKGFALATF